MYAYRNMHVWLYASRLRSLLGMLYSPRYTEHSTLVSILKECQPSLLKRNVILENKKKERTYVVADPGGGAQGANAPSRPGEQNFAD